MAFLQKVSFCKITSKNTALFSACRRKKIVFAVASLIIIFNNILYPQEEIPVVVSSNSQVYIKVLSGLKYSTKIPLRIIIFNENKDELNNLLIQYPNNLPIVTIGNQATYYLRKYSNLKNIFTITNYSREGIEYEKGNSCGYFSEIPIQRLFLSLKDFSKDARKITTFYTSQGGNYYTQISRQIDFQYGLNFKSIQLALDDDINLELKKLKGSTDAFIILADPLYSKENFEILSKFCKENNILLFSNLSSLTDLGIAYSLDLDYFDIGIRTGNLVNEIMKSPENCNFGPYYFPERDILKINGEYLNESGFKIPVELVKKTEIDDLNGTAMDLYFNGKKGTALNIFNYILKKNPSDENANKYSKIIINEKYEDQVKGLLEEGNKLFESKRFLDAKAVYEKITKINPNIPNIKEKIDLCVFQYSEQKRVDALSYQNSGKYFQAIPLFIESLKIYPSNSNARNALNELRYRLSEKVPGMIEEGLLFYNHRKYKEAIVVFKNILMIEEGNKKSKEYLRLSQEKMEALEKLTNCKQAKENPCAL